MGACISQGYEFSITMTGLDLAGKSSIIRSLEKENDPLDTTPTVGHEETTLEISGCTFKMWTPGGELKIRELWRHYLVASTAALIFVCDATDRERIDSGVNSAKHELGIMLGYDELARDAPLLIFANKQDLQNPLSVEEISAILDVKKISKNRPVKVIGSSAKTGEGLMDGLKWLRDILVQKSKSQ